MRPVVELALSQSPRALFFESGPTFATDRGQLVEIFGVVGLSLAFDHLRLVGFGVEAGVPALDCLSQCVLAAAVYCGGGRCGKCFLPDFGPPPARRISLR